MKFLIVVEKAKSGFSAYSPDLPGCVATGSTRPAAVARMRAAIRFHLEGMRADGQRVPRQKASSTYIEIPA
jgi:predicted RNase H-like HicB family nuclease